MEPPRLPERPPPRPFVGPGRAPPRASRGRRVASTLATLSAVVLFALPVVWFAATRRPAGPDAGTATTTFVAPLTVASVDSALALARRDGAAIVVSGVVVVTPDSLRVVARAHDVASGALLREQTAGAPRSANAQQLFDSLAVLVATPSAVNAPARPDTSP